MIDSGALDPYPAQLRSLDQQSRLRTLKPKTGLDFTSNDYLGLATSHRLRDAIQAALDRGTPVGRWRA